jgi:hypothetical protein
MRMSPSVPSMAQLVVEKVHGGETQPSTWGDDRTRPENGAVVVAVVAVVVVAGGVAQEARKARTRRERMVATSSPTSTSVNTCAAASSSSVGTCPRHALSAARASRGSCASLL